MSLAAKGNQSSVTVMLESPTIEQKKHVTQPGIKMFLDLIDQFIFIDNGEGEFVSNLLV